MGFEIEAPDVVGGDFIKGVYSNVTQATAGITPADSLPVNTNIAIIPKGMGGIVAALPNGATSGGNARGNFAVDLQLERNSALHVASGLNSGIFSGRRNTASGSYSGVFSGDANNASGAVSVIAGGGINVATSNFSGIFASSSCTVSNTNSGIYSSVNSIVTGPNSVALAGIGANISGSNSVGIGPITISGANSFGSGANNISGANSAALGTGSAATANQSFVSGASGATYLTGQRSHSNGAYFAVGDAQISDLILRRIVQIDAGNTQNLFIDGASILAIPNANNKIWLAEITCIATVNNVGTAVGLNVGDTWAQKFIVTLKRIGGVSTLLGAAASIYQVNDVGMGGASFNISAGASQQLNISFTAPPISTPTTNYRLLANYKLLEAQPIN